MNLIDILNRGELYEYKEIGRMNGQMLNVVKFTDRTLDFHFHEKSDEAFYVLDGNFALEFDDGIVSLNAGDLINIPKCMRHRPVCTSLVKILLIDTSGALNNENHGGTYN